MTLLPIANDPHDMYSLLAVNYCVFAMFAILTYDWLIRINDELRLFCHLRRGHKPPIAALTYMLGRYSPIIQFAILVRSTHPMSETECRVNNVVQAGAGLLSILSPAIFSTLRVYALSRRNKALATIAFLFCCVPFVINTMSEIRFVEVVNMHVPFNCSGKQTMPNDLLHGVTIASRTCLIVGDLIVLIVTWMNTYTVTRVKRELYGRQSILDVMLCNGCFCFIIITSMNAAQMIIAPLKIQSVLNVCGYVNLFITPITSILICHFLLDLHQAGHIPASTSSLTNVSPIQFVARRTSANLSRTRSSSVEFVEGDLLSLASREIERPVWSRIRVGGHQGTS